jgi:hypothetical protein
MMKRIVVSMLIGIVLGVVISEFSFIFLQETARPPQEVILTIPAGTAEKVHAANSRLPFHWIWSL